MKTLQQSQQSDAGVPGSESGTVSFVVQAESVDSRVSPHEAPDPATQVMKVSAPGLGEQPVSWMAVPLCKRRVGTYLGVIGLGLFFLFLRLRNCDAPLIRDEGEFLYAARLLKHGFLPYQHSFLQKPPMVVYLYALADFIAPSLFWFPRILADISVALATGMLGWLVRREFGRGLALPAMWLLTPMLLLPSLNASTALAEVFMLLPLLATVALYVKNHERHSRPGVWFLAGAIGAVTLLHKYTALPLVGVVFCSWALEERRRGRPISQLSGLYLCALAGALVAAIAFLGWFLVSDGGKHLWECTVRFNRFYAASSNFGFRSIWSVIKNLWSCWQILFFLPVVLIFRRPARCWFWIVMLVAAVLCTGGSAYGQYYILLMPFWAVLVALGIDSLCTWTARRFNWSKSWTSGGLTAGVVALVCLPGVATILASPSSRELAGFGPLNPFSESIPVAKRVAQLASPQDYVFVAGSEPQILCYAHRLSPTRFIVAYPLMIPSPLAERFQKEALRDLAKNPPAVVVEVHSSTSWLTQPTSPSEFREFLSKILLENYERVGGYVLDGPDRGWREPLSPEDAFHCSLVVFRRKTEASPSFHRLMQPLANSGSRDL